MANILFPRICILLLGVAWQVCGERKILQPCGPKLCAELCQKYNCSAKVFDEIQLSYELTLKHKCKIPNKVAMGRPKRNQRCSVRNLRSFEIAVAMKNLSEVEILLDKGILDVNCVYQNHTLVMYATEFNWTEAFDLLVKRNCDLAPLAKYKFTILHLACQNGANEIVVKLLENHCSDIESKDLAGRTPLQMAAYKGHLRVLKLLIDRGADIYTVNDFRNNLLHVACSGGHVDVIEYVLSLNVSDIEKKGKNDFTPLFCAVQSGNVSAVMFLVKRNANVLTLDKHYMNVLHVACYFERVPVVSYLVTLKAASVLAKMTDRRGRTPIQFAELKHNHTIVDLLKSHSLN